MEMTPISRRRGNIERLSYQPSKPYHYDLEIFRVSNLKQRTRAEAMHWTYSYEFYMLICITQGRCIQLLDFEPVSCSAGTLLVLRPGQAHNFGRDEGWDGWIILFRPELLLPAASSPHDLRPSFNLDRLPERLSLDSRQLNRATAAIRRMRDDSLLDTFLRSNIPSSENVDRTNELTADVHALLRYQFYAFVTWLTVVHGQRRIQEPRHSGSMQRFNRFQRLVEKHFAEWNQVSDYTRHLGCTERSLTRATTLAVGMSAKAFISRRINLEAKRLLVHTDLPVGVIAERLGFQEATHFSKFFKRETSCTPKEFRARSDAK